MDHLVMGYPHLLLYVALVAREGALTAPQSYCPLINTLLMDPFIINISRGGNAADREGNYKVLISGQ